MRIVGTGNSALAVFERGAGSPGRPTIVLAHGWPDSSAVWDAVADLLADRYHVVTYDARGIGQSARPDGRRPYALERMADDLDAVARATSPAEPPHLVGHDWGSVAGWEYVGDPDRRLWAASFTSISGPCLDHLGHSMRDRLRRPTPRRLAPVLGQAIRSSYVGLFHVPVVSTLPWRLGLARAFRWFLRTVEDVPTDDRHPAATLPRDAVRGVHLYRTNVVRRLARARTRRATVPVQLVVATGDRYVTPGLTDDVTRWAPDLRRRDIDAGHWSPRTHPQLVADLIAEHVEAVEAATARSTA